jgi:hypothetical protein
MWQDTPSYLRVCEKSQRRGHAEWRGNWQKRGLHIAVLGVHDCLVYWVTRDFWRRSVLFLSLLSFSSCWVLPCFLLMHDCGVVVALLLECHEYWVAIID